MVFSPIVASCIEGITYLSRELGVVDIGTNSTLYSLRIQICNIEFWRESSRSFSNQLIVLCSESHDLRIRHKLSDIILVPIQDFVVNCLDVVGTIVVCCGTDDVASGICTLDELFNAIARAIEIVVYQFCSTLIVWRVIISVPRKYLFTVTAGETPSKRERVYREIVVGLILVG